MTAKPRNSNAASEVDKLERILARLTEAEQRKFINEDILRLEKNGNLSYESIRTTATPTRSVSEELPLEATVPSDQSIHHSPTHHSPTHHSPTHHLFPNTLPETPVSQEIGNSIGAVPEDLEVNHGRTPNAELNDALALTTASVATCPVDQQPAGTPISYHEPQNSGNQVAPSPVPCPPFSVSLSAPSPAPSPPKDPDPLEELLRRAIAVAHVRRGRPPAFDDHSKGQLVALLSVGMSMRQAAAVLGVSHTTVQKTLKADPALAEEITAARFQAQLQPLACVIREARRSWKAATWLLKYLDSKIASHEETPDERSARQEREAQEFFARSATPGVKQRRELA